MKVVWRAVMRVIAPGVLTVDNAQPLARYCTDLVRWWKLAAWLGDPNNPEICEAFDKLGNIKYTRHPNVITYERLGTSLLRIEQQFGLTPSARAQVQAIGGQSKKPKPLPGGAPLRLAQ